ncbi:MAG: hypothetical protein IAI48_12740 [Candidatus Eremiobacteraeota bacterium]|nr:hypothetical protein [Candidatus Eremiobacteraeota bacterium]
MRFARYVVAAAVLSCASSHASAARPSTAARIATLLALPAPLPIDTRDLATPSKLRDALATVGLVQIAGGRYAFTPRGIAASSACPRADDLDDPATRCFTIATRGFDGIVGTRTAAATIDAGARDIWFFRLRARPSTPLGLRLAAAGALVCNDRNGAPLAWRGKRTIAFGEYSRSAGRVDDVVVGADCPHGPRYLSPVDSR